MLARNRSFWWGTVDFIANILLLLAMPFLWWGTEFPGLTYLRVACWMVIIAVLAQIVVLVRDRLPSPLRPEGTSGPAENARPL